MLKNPVSLLLVFLGLATLTRRQTDKQRRLFSALGVWMLAAKGETRRSQLPWLE